MGEAERWSWLREQTPAATAGVYLNAGWSGPLSLPVAAAMQDWIAREVAEGPTSAAIFAQREADRERLRDAFAALLGADPGAVAITASAADGINLVLGSLPLAVDDNVVLSSVEHPSVIVPAHYAGARHGSELRIVPIDGRLADTEILHRFALAIDSGTRAVVVSHVSYATGQILPLREIAALAHEHGAIVIADGAQTAGHLPLDIDALGVDAYAINGHKWLCGPEGVGALFVRPDVLRNLLPVRVSMHGAAKWDPVGSFEAAPDAIRKLELGTLSPVLILGALAAIEQYETSGRDAVLARVRELHAVALERLAGLRGIEVSSPADEATRCGLLTFRVAGLDAALLAREIETTAGVVTRAVPHENALRLSLHVYNTVSDIDAAAEAIAAVVREHAPRSRVGALVDRLLRRRR